MEYRVQWEIDIDAESHEDAARQAAEIMRDPESTLPVFDVTDENGKTFRIDTEELPL